MKRKLIIGILTGTMVISTVLSGCGSSVSNESPASASAEASAVTEAPHTVETMDSESNEGTHEITSSNIPFYSGGAHIGDLPLYFLDGVTDLPYVEANNIPDVLGSVMSSLTGEYSFSAKTDGSVVTIIRNNKNPDAMDNGVYADFDFENDTITFQDYDLFCWKSGATTLLDVTTVNTVNANGEPMILQKVNKDSLDRYGDELVVRAGDYGIDFVEQDGKYLVPLQTLVDFTSSPGRNINLFYNGQVVIAADQMDMGNEIYYAAPTGDRSETLTEYGYNELCMMLDYCYGLKDVHEIESFDKLFHSVNFDTVLKEQDPANADIAIDHMIWDYLDDGHSAWLASSYLAGSVDYGVKPGTSAAQWIAEGDRYSEARKKYYPDGIPGYEEFGNTAYITFDSFAISNPNDMESYYLAEDVSKFADTDTIGLIMKAHEQITRENSPIENVVLDLSNNEGGAADAAVFVLGWLLGEASVGVENTMTGAMSSATYRSDVNRDRKFDEKDTVAERNIYCLISPFSFSCGNLVPNVLKASNKATLLGRTSGGGSCMVQFASSAWGSSFRISSPKRLSFLKNGSFYDIDRGAEPDYLLSQPEEYYDRAALTEYINSLH